MTLNAEDNQHVNINQAIHIHGEPTVDKILPLTVKQRPNSDYMVEIKFSG